MNRDQLDDVTVALSEPPDPGQIRPAITAALSGLPWPAGPEHDIAVAVAAAVRAHRDQRVSSQAVLP
jgi:hypothetical protein